MEDTMNRLWIITSLLLPVWLTSTDEALSQETIVGKLSCQILPHSGINLLIHSTRDIRCQFKPADGSATEHYKGETGIRFGLDVSIDRSEKITYSVLADHFKPGTHQLAGKYSGAGGEANLGIAVGDSAPIRKRDRSVSLQPINTRHQGAGVAAGLNYIYLEADQP